MFFGEKMIDDKKLSDRDLLMLEKEYLDLKKSNDLKEKKNILKRKIAEEKRRRFELSSIGSFFNKRKGDL